VPPYVIFHDTTLAALAEVRPSDRDELLRVPGLGPVKAERYGPDLLALVAEHRRSA
jgi:DNA helicase-2/ATP-dependent DNA helicase PcrA